MAVIATVCTRAGSKGVPGKNTRPLLGKPLMLWTIEQALAAPSIDAVYVSTDSEQMAALAVTAGASVLGLRPPELAGDRVSKVDVIQDLVARVVASGVEVDTVVDLDATSPLREIADIESAIALLDEDCDVVITGCPADKNPYFNMVEERPDGTVGLVKPPARGVTSRQSAPPVYAMNASIYVWRLASLALGLWEGRPRLYVMPPERSVDVDTPLDWELVQILMRRRLEGVGEHA